MKLRYLIGLILLVAVILLVRNYDFTGLSVLEKKDCTSFEEIWEEEDCYIDLAVQSLNASSCDFIEDRTHNVCLNEVSKAKNDVLLCNEIKNDTFWSDICYKNFAEFNGNEEYCDKITHAGDKDGCFTTIALDKENVELCQRIESEDESQKCIYEVAKESQNEELCRLVNHPLNKDICFNKLAKIKKDANICELIKYKVVKESCDKFFEV